MTDLASLKTVKSADADKLQGAGVTSLEDLSTMDVAKVADRSGLPKRRLFAWQAQAAVQLLATEGVAKLKSVTRDVRARLEKADVEKIGELARARIAELQKRSGVAMTKLKKVQKEARDRLAAARTDAGLRTKTVRERVRAGTLTASAKTVDAGEKAAEALAKGARTVADKLPTWTEKAAEGTKSAATKTAEGIRRGAEKVEATGKRLARRVREKIQR